MGGIGSWEALPPRNYILIATPHTGLVKYEYAISLKALQVPTHFNIISNKGLPIDRARCDLVEQARLMQCSHIFFLDSDVLLPSDGLWHLWNWKLPIVAGIYGSKHETPGVWIETAKSGSERYAAVLPEVLAQNRLFTHPDIVIGAGCVLIDMQVFNRIEKPYFLWTQGREDGGVSEDFYFFEKIRKAGVPIHVDTAVRCKHIDIDTEIDWSGKRQRVTL